MSIFRAPRSLFGRNLLLIVGLLAASQLVSGLLLRELIVKPRIDQLAAFSATTLEAIRGALEVLPPAQRDAFIARINQRGSVRVEPASEPVSGFGKPASPLIRRYLEALDHLLPDGEAEIEWKTEPQRTLWIRVNIAGGSYWVTAVPGRLEAGLPRVWLWLSLCCTLLAILGAVLIQRLLDRPFRALIAASENLGEGRRDAPLPETGPLEIAAVSRSFNRMTERLTQAERERAIMLAGVSHDLRSPLSKLRLAIEILGEDAEPELIAGMVRNVESMDAIIGQFLDFARAGSDEARADCALDELVRHSLEQLGAATRFTLEVAELPPLRLRPLAMQRLIANLVENAQRYGAAPFELQLARDADGIRLSVLDRGPGIAPEEAERLKQAFARGDAARGGAAGAGLGLAIVERIATLHGGRLDLLPRAGGGLEARVTLPLPA